MASRDVISIILTTCCESEYRLSLLKVSIKNLFRNTEMRRKQLIVSDNGNDKQTEYLKTIKWDKHLMFGENKGLVYGRNAGAEVATGNYICFIDGDLIYRRNWLRTLKALIVGNPDRKLIASGRLSENMLLTDRYVVAYDLRKQIWSRTAGGCLLMTRQAWEEVGPWPDFWRMGAGFCNNANAKGYNFIIPIPEVAMPLDFKTSYSKKLLRMSYENNEEPVWEMTR